MGVLIVSTKHVRHQLATTPTQAALSAPGVNHWYRHGQVVLLEQMVWANVLFSGWLRDDPIAAEHGEAPPTGGKEGMGRNGQQSATAQLAGHLIGQASNALPGKPLKSFYRTSGLTNETWHWNKGERRQTTWHQRADDTQEAGEFRRHT